MGGARGGLPLPPPFPAPSCQRKMLMVPRCKLSSVIFSRKHKYFFAFSNIKKQANLWLPMHVQKLKVFQLQGGALPPDFLTSVSAPGPHCIFPCAQQPNKVDIWATHKKSISPLRPSPCPPLPFQLQISSPAHQ